MGTSIRNEAPSAGRRSTVHLASLYSMRVSAPEMGSKATNNLSSCRTISPVATAACSASISISASAASAAKPASLLNVLRFIALFHVREKLRGLYWETGLLRMLTADSGECQPPVSSCRVLRLTELFCKDVAMRKDEPLGAAQQERIGNDRGDGERAEKPRGQPRLLEITRRHRHGNLQQHAAEQHRENQQRTGAIGGSGA